MNRRTLTLGAALVAMLCTAALPAAAETIPLLRDQAIVAEGNVHLGDVFANVDQQASRVIAAAPAPGARMILDAEQLMAIAAANGISWQPRSRFDRITIERESRVVDAREIERQLADAIAAASGRVEFEVDVENRQQIVHLPVGGEVRIEIENLRDDARGRRATATLLAPNGDGGMNRVPVTARLFPVVDVPVLRGPVMPGQAIGESDLDWASVRADRLRRDMITDARWMIGMTPRRAITPGLPVAVRDLQERIVVQKNSMVTIVLRSGSLTLTARGKALEDGALGAAIRVLNPRSDRVVEATVISPDTVEIQSLQMIGAAQVQAASNVALKAGSYR
jgi:flagella basal body P-ring formation protein FlgA